MLHDNFFNYHDLIQNRYELLRLVKYEKIYIEKAVSILGFNSRSSYYLFYRQFKEEGFSGLFDLRPLNRKITINDNDIIKTNTDSSNSISFYNEEYNYKYTKRPQEAIWYEYNSRKNVFYGLWGKNRGIFIQVIKALVEGNGVRGISRIFDIDKNIVLNYLQRAAFQCRKVTNHFIRDMNVEELQIDEMWSFVYKKEKNLTEEEYMSCLKGDQWEWITKDVRTKVIIQYEIGKRTYQLANDLIKNFKQRTNGTIPSLIMSDGYKGYKLALLKYYGIKVKGKKQKIAPPEMDYAVVKKIRKKGRVVDIKIKVIFGDLERIERKLKESPVSNTINVAFIERCNLSRRQFNRRLSRKTIGYSKKLENHLWQFELETAVHNFVRPHAGLGYITPMMAAGKTDHIWSIEELLSYLI